MTTVDRGNPLPLYVQLERALLTKMRQDGLRPGDRIPTEAEIAETYAVSRATIRQALTRLTADGYVERIQGLGSFVAKPRPTHTPLLTSFTENMRSQGYRPSRRVVESSTIETPEDQLAILGSEATRCQYLLRLMLADDEPVGVSETWLPVDVLGGRLDLFEASRLEASSLYDVLQGPEIGLRLERGLETVRPGTASAEVAALLGCAEGAPTLVVRRITYSPSNRTIESTVMTFSGDRYEYRIDMRRPPAGPGGSSARNASGEPAES